MPSSALRYLLYSHDTYGLGHFRRAALIAGGIVASSPTAQVLIATGSPRAQAFSLPEQVDSLKLPAVTKDGAGRYQPRKITADLEELVELRASLLVAACASFRPDVVVVDQAPTGMAGELIPMLQMIDDLAVRPRLVLGLRDIVDDAATVDDQWSRHREWDWLERYDDIAVYGDPQILTTADEMSLASRLPARVTHTGYVAPNMPEASQCEPYILVTPGGGGDGQALIRQYLDAVDAVTAAGVKSLIVTGPLMSASRRAELVIRAEERPQMEIIEFSDNMRQLVASSIGVVSMAGYNTVVEQLASGTPSMLVPRTAPRLEQDIRARRLGPHTNLERCPVEQLSTSRLAAFVERALAGRVRSPLNLCGVARVSSLLTNEQPRVKEPISA
jgi:predicted glycosyltransferase